ncbi:hypothetical protein ACJ8CY_01955 [Klebsiella pneumoniae]
MNMMISYQELVRTFPKRLAVVVLLARWSPGGFSFSWYIFITPKVPVVPGNINKNEKSLSIAGKPLTHRYKQSDSDDSSLIIHSIYLSSTSNVQSDSTIINGGDCSYSDTSDSGCSGGD